MFSVIAELVDTSVIVAGTIGQDLQKDGFS
jgi:hypothetical protein